MPLVIIWIKVILHEALELDKVVVSFTGSIVGITIYTTIGYYIKSNSKKAVVLPLFLMIMFGIGPNIIIGYIHLLKAIFTNSDFQPTNKMTWYWATIEILLAIIYINGIRGVFAHNKYKELKERS